MKSVRPLIRPLVQRLQAYVPGEQPKVQGLIKLNTNENPYPPSPAVLRAVKAGVDARLRLYPNPTSDPLRRRLSRLHRCKIENIVVGNGSDELLALATRAFVEPLPDGRASHAKLPNASRLQFFTPSYSLYPVLADIHGAGCAPVPLGPGFSLPAADRSGRGGRRSAGALNPDAALTFVTTPNAPTGRGYTTHELDALCRSLRGVVVLDEAYVDFADEHALSLALKHRHVLVTRTFSKAYALCFQRVGYAVGHPDLIAALHKIKDSYNVNGLGQLAALATLDDLPYYRANFQRVRATRTRLCAALRSLGFEVFPSQANFLLARPPGLPAERWLHELRKRKILVRWFSSPSLCDYLRISVGSETETDALLDAARAILTLGETGARCHGVSRSARGKVHGQH